MIEKSSYTSYNTLTKKTTTHPNKYLTGPIQMHLTGPIQMHLTGPIQMKFYSIHCGTNIHTWPKPIDPNNNTVCLLYRRLTATHRHNYSSHRLVNTQHMTSHQNMTIILTHHITLTFHINSRTMNRTDGNSPQPVMTIALQPTQYRHLSLADRCTVNFDIDTVARLSSLVRPSPVPRSTADWPLWPPRWWTSRRAWWGDAPHPDGCNRRYAIAADRVGEERSGQGREKAGEGG